VFIWYIFPVLVSCTKKNLATLFGSPTHFFSKLVREKRTLGYFCNFQNLPKVNNRPTGENSPNLPTFHQIFRLWIHFLRGSPKLIWSKGKFFVKQNSAVLSLLRISLICRVRFGERGSLIPFCVSSRVARWHMFKIPNFPIWVNFWGSCNGRCWRIYGHLVYFVAIWSILWLFGIFMVIWYIFTRFCLLYKEKSGNPGLQPFPGFKDETFGSANYC
jgi:hypothetical protein